MSAWLVSNEHINVLIAYALDNDVSLHPANDPESACRLLTEENMRSLRARYPGRDFLDEWETLAKTFKYERNEKPLFTLTAMAFATQIIKACDCYDYQACETDDYNQTPVAAFVERVRVKAMSQGGVAKGKLYDQMAWGLNK